MPQQQPPQFDFNPGAVQGPFSGMLMGQTPTYQTAPNTGWSTKTGSVLNVVTSFLGGIERGRVKSYEREQQQEAKQRGVVMDYINMKLRDPNLTDEGRAALEKQGMQYMARTVLSETDGKGKKKGGDEQQGIMGHIAGAFHDIALGMVGGQLPKKGKGEDIDPAQFMANVDALSQNPKFSKAAAVQMAQQQVQNILKQVPTGADQQVILRALQGSPDQPGPLVVMQKNMDPQAFRDYVGNLIGGYAEPLRTAGTFQSKLAELEKAGVHLTEAQKQQAGEAYMGVKQQAERFMPFFLDGRQAPDSVTQDAMGNPIDRTGNTQYKIEEGTNRWFPATAGPVGGTRAITEPDGKPVIVRGAEAIGKTPAPPQLRPEEIKKAAAARFQKIQDTEQAEYEKADKQWAEIKAITDNRNADALKKKLGVDATGFTSDQWKAVRVMADNERARARNEALQRKQLAVDQANREFYGMDTNYAKEAEGGGGEAPPETRTGGGETPGARPGGWTNDHVNKFQSLIHQ